MIDTLWLKYRIRDRVEYERLLGLMRHLGMSSYINNGHVYHKAQLRNLEVGLSDDFLRIKGSLPKFYLGSNVQSLTPDQIKFALVKLSDLLQINIFAAELRRVDISQCFRLRYPVADYLCCFEDTPEFKSYFRAASETRTYKKQNYAVVFYDKKAEAKRNAEADRDFSNVNLIRIEVQFQRRLRDEFRYKRLQVVHLLSRGFLAKLITRWMADYFKIYQKHLLVDDYSQYENRQKRKIRFVKNIELWGGRSRFHEMSDREAQDGLISFNQRKYFKRTMRKLYSEKAIFQEIPILEELNCKVRGHYLITIKRLNS